MTTTDFPTTCREFAESFGWGGRQKAADALGIPLSTFDGWCAGRPPQHEKIVRMAMHGWRAMNDIKSSGF